MAKTWRWRVHRSLEDGSDLHVCRPLATGHRPLFHPEAIHLPKPLVRRVKKNRKEKQDGQVGASGLSILTVFSLNYGFKHKTLGEEMAKMTKKMAKNKRQTSQIGLHRRTNGWNGGKSEKAGKTVNAIIIMGQPGKKTKDF